MGYIYYIKRGSAMKKKNIINLIRFHAEKNEAAFREEAYEVARDFDLNGDSQLAEYIMALMSSANTFVPQMYEGQATFFQKVEFGPVFFYLF